MKTKPQPKRRSTPSNTRITKKPVPIKPGSKRRLFALMGGIIAVLFVGLFIYTLITAEDETLADTDADYSSRSISSEERRPATDTDTDLLPTSTPSKQLRQDPELLELLRAVGAYYLQNLEFTFVTSYPDGGDTDGEYEEFYYYDDEDEGFDYGVMTVRRGLDVEEQRRTVAHEYLHHVWYAKLTPTLRNTLTSHLNAMLATDEYMQEYEEQYRDSGGLIPTELFSFYCTEVSDSKLVQFVLDQCNRFIDRSQLVMLN